MPVPSSATTAKRQKVYDEILKDIGKARRIDPYPKNAKVKILHECMIHKEQHLASPGDLRRGRPMPCCAQASKANNGSRQIAKAAREYDKKIAKYGKVVRLDPYIHSQVSIRHRCLIHNEIHLAAPSHVAQGKGLKCCWLANNLKNANAQKKQASASYDKALSKHGKLKRVESYIDAVTPIAHRCIKCGFEGTIRPQDAKRGGGLSCCAYDAQRVRMKRLNEACASSFKARLLESLPQLRVMEDYVDAVTKIKIYCTIHDKIYRVAPESLLSKGRKGLLCCRDAAHQNFVDRLKESKKKSYDEDIAVWGRLQRLGEYVDSRTPILHRCIRHGEEHKCFPNAAKNGGGLICCNRGKGWDTLENIIDEKRLKTEAGTATSLYIFSVPSHQDWVKIGISSDVNARARTTSSLGLYGNLLASWEFSTRTQAILFETALLRDSSMEGPDGCLDELKGQSGFSELRRIDAKTIIHYVELLIDSYHFSDCWQRWALENIPNLRDWEEEALVRQVDELSTD